MLHGFLCLTYIHVILIPSNITRAPGPIIHVSIIHGHISCCAISRAVSRRHLVSDTRIQAEVSLCGICAGERSSGTGFCQGISVPPPPRPAQLVFHIHSPISEAIQSWQLTSSDKGKGHPATGRGGPRGSG